MNLKETCDAISMLILDTEDAEMRTVLRRTVRDLNRLIDKRMPTLEQDWFHPFIVRGEDDTQNVFNLVGAVHAYRKLYPSAGLTRAKNMVESELARIFPFGYQMIEPASKN